MNSPVKDWFTRLPEYLSLLQCSAYAAEPQGGPGVRFIPFMAIR